MPSDESSTIHQPSGSLIPYPGDGICPSTAQFENAVRAGYELWSSLGSDSIDDSSLPCTADCLVDLLRHVPAFYAQHAKAFSILDEPFPQVKYALEWITTTDATCDQPVKRSHHCLTLGILEPVGYKFLDASEACPYWPGIGADRAHYISYLIFGWTYILSCRWAEILQDAGEEVFLRQSEELNHRNFWEVVAGPRWQAIIVRGGNTFHAPWSLALSDAAPRYAQKLAFYTKSTLTWALRTQLLKVSPNSSSAFDILVDYCKSEGITRECIAALAIVLTLPERTDSPFTIPYLTTPLKLDATRGQNSDCYKSLYDYLSSCITLSCSSEAIESLLCGVFFYPTVPCNLVGAHLLGIMKAIEPLQSDPGVLARRMAKNCPKVSPLWLATIWNGQVSRILKSVAGGLPPISLPAASWTETIQSFLQVRYLPINDRRDAILRAREYSVAYLVRPDILIPFTPSPPFGETATSNLSLEVKMHLNHNHRPIQHNTNWMLDTGEELPDQRGPKSIPQPNLHLPQIARLEYVKGSLQK